MRQSAKDLIGMRSGYLTVLSYAGKNANGRLLIKARCDCGKEIILRASNFLYGNSKSCGCKKIDMIRAAATIHGKKHHPLYKIWEAMKRRCLSQKCRNWKNYGGRGIKVCDRWLNSFQNFWDDMSSGYKKGLSLDRIDVNGNYCPENCRWVDYKTQARNKRNSRFLNTPWGVITLAEAAEKSKIPAATLLRRIYRQWPEDMLFIKPNPANRYTTLKMQAQTTASQLKPKQDQ